MPHKLAQWRTNQVIDRAINEISTLNQMLKDGTDPTAVAAWLGWAPTRSVTPLPIWASGSTMQPSEGSPSTRSAPTSPRS